MVSKNGLTVLGDTRALPKRTHGVCGFKVHLNNSNVFLSDSTTLSSLTVSPSPHACPQCQLYWGYYSLGVIATL